MMIRILFLAILVLSHLATSGQSLKKKRKGDEIFYVLESDESVRHGEYQRRSSGRLTAKGQYEMNEKVGDWEFYGLDGGLEQKYNYTEKVLLQNERPTEIATRYSIIRDGVVQEKSPSIAPILIGGSSAFLRHLLENIKYPPDARQRGTQGTVFISAIVTSEGVMKDVQILQGLGHGCDEEALRVMKLFKSEWIPGSDNGEQVDVMMVFPIVFRLG